MGMIESQSTTPVLVPPGREKRTNNNHLNGHSTVLSIIEQTSTISKMVQDPNVSSVEQAYYDSIQQPNLSLSSTRYYEPLSIMDNGNDYHDYNDYSDHNDRSNATSSRSIMQQKHEPFYRDLPYAVAFLLHLALVLFLAVCFGSFDGLFGQDQNAGKESDWESFFVKGVCLPIMAVLISISIMLVSIGAFIPRYPKASVLVSLYVSVLGFFLVMVQFYFNTEALLIIWGYFLPICVAILALVSIKFSVFFGFLTVIVFFMPASIWILCVAAYLFWYIQARKKYVPYAAAMLKIATTGVAKNWGLYIVSFIVSIAFTLWAIIWLYMVNGLTKLNDVSSTVTLFSLLSLYWTFLVFRNLLQATVAGAIGSYCFHGAHAAPSTTTCHVQVVNSLKQSCTTSFGSICFGSLLNGIFIPLQILADWALPVATNNNSNGNGRTGVLLCCCLDCILSLIPNIIIKYFNHWCYVFVGIYGLDYIESGNTVVELFQARGCSAILTDSLATYHVLNTLVYATGLVCGIVGGDIWDMDNPLYLIVIGAMVSSTIVLASIVNSALKAVLVCYADHPEKMHESHPEDAKDLADAIALLYPEVQTLILTEPSVVV